MKMQGVILTHEIVISKKIVTSCLYFKEKRYLCAREQRFTASGTTTLNLANVFG